MSARLDQRLPALRARDVILAALQAAFAAEDLVGGDTSPYLFVPTDPSRSSVWVCAPEGRAQYSGRDGRRMVITVSRGDYVPQDLHLQNLQSADFHSNQSYTDLGTTILQIMCEAGTEVASEVLASICYGILKVFRPQIMEDYDIHNYRLMSISAPSFFAEAPGAPWVTTVMLRLEVQEFAAMSEIANRLNRLDLAAAYTARAEAVVASLDATSDLASP